MKLTNQQIKEAYQRENGPELHPARATDTGLKPRDLMISIIVLIVLTAILVRVL